jgi:hypothetical protein
LKQVDFSSSVRENMAAVNENEREEEMGEIQSSPVKDPPPTPPPKELPAWRAASLPAFVEAPPHVPTPAPEPPRLKKKIPWKGKNIMVLLPWDDERGQNGHAPTPMNQRDVDAMFKEWVQLGYDISGFNLGPPEPNAEEGSQGQSRGIWPYDQDVLTERAQRFRVSIPDRRGEFAVFFSECRKHDCFSRKMCCWITFLRSCQAGFLSPRILIDGSVKSSIDTSAGDIPELVPSTCHILPRYPTL